MNTLFAALIAAGVLRRVWRGVGPENVAAVLTPIAIRVAALVAAVAATVFLAVAGSQDMAGSEDVVGSAGVAGSQDEAISPGAADGPAPLRPEWIDQRPGLRGGVYEIVARSGLYATPGECEHALEAAERAAAAGYLEMSLEPGAGRLVPLETQYIRDRLRRGEFQETTRASFGLMRQSYSKLAFDPAVREELRARWRIAKAGQRLWDVGAVAAVVLAAIGSAYAWLLASNRRAAAPRSAEAAL